MSVTLRNPLLAGFHPDPSICRVDDDFYMVTSSFSFYPGVPIYHSRDLANWEQIGHVLDRPSQLPLDYHDISGGIFAPTIRFHDGIFYVITTNVSYGGNFIVTATDPKGPWSEPHWIVGAGGIDPSIFWDEDKKAYYSGTYNDPNTGKQYIWLQELDLDAFCLTGKMVLLWAGSLAESYCPEGPHIYKIGEYYYLMIAEGGTEHYHSETIARSKSLFGPYEGFRGNPILTQRHLGMQADIANTGHADLVELKDGSWYIVFLASRPYGGYHKNLGRETFIAPVVWEAGWPVVSPGTGRILLSYEGPDLVEQKVPEVPIKDDFNKETLDYCWNLLGTPDEKTYLLENSMLKIRFTQKPFSRTQDTARFIQGFKKNPNKPEAIGFVGRRQEHMSFEAAACVRFDLKKTQTAGLCVLQNGYHQLRVELYVGEDGQRKVRAVKGCSSTDISLVNKHVSEPYSEVVLGKTCWEEEEAVPVIRANRQNFTLAVQTKDGREIILAKDVNGGFMGSETAGGFVGAYVGMFASGNGTDYDDYASFDWCSYRGLD